MHLRATKTADLSQAQNPAAFAETDELFDVSDRTKVYLKSRKFSLFLQTQRDFALKRLGIHKGFLRLSALNPAVFAKYPSFSLFSDTPPAPSFQSILCKLQPLTRHSVRHLPYNIVVLPCVNLQLIYLKQL